MTHAWRQCRLQDIADAGSHGFVDGPFGSNLPASCYAPQGVPVIRGSNLSLGDHRFHDTGFVFVSEDTAQRLNRSICRSLDIIFTKKGTIGQTGIVPTNARFERYLLSSNQMKLTVDRSLADPLYVYYFLSSSQSRIKILRDSEATGVPKTNLAYFRDFPIRLPPLHEQRRIGEILGTLDDKIELNRQTAETLEAMARALFKSWFVDFDPVRAKAEVRAEHPKWTNAQVSRAALPNLDPEVAEQFPDAFQDSALGKIPMGWEVTRLSSHIEATKGLSYKGSGLSEAGIPLHNLNSVLEGGGYKFGGIKHYVGEYRDRHVVRPGDLIVTNTEQGHDCLLLGYAAIVPRLFGDLGIFSHHIFRVRPIAHSPVRPAWLCHLLNSSAMHDTVSGYGNGTTVNMLPVAGLQHPDFVLPSATLISRFDRLATTAFERCEHSVTENYGLATLRDALLPRLLSGDLSLTEQVA